MQENKGIQESNSELVNNNPKMDHDRAEAIAFAVLAGELFRKEFGKRSIL